MENQTSAAASSSSASTSYRNFDVFINHRGPDVKDTFAAHLYRRLLDYGLQVFLDKPELQAGEEITPQIKEAIQVSSVHVAIFSPTYAESTWCLDELRLMVESRKKAKSRVTILPVFYKVKPSELKWTAGSYAKALRSHRQKKTEDPQTGEVKARYQLRSHRQKKTEDPETGEVKARYQLSTIQKWRSALFYAADISGFELNGDDQEELLNKVVQAVLKKVPKPLLEVAKYPTGVDDKLQDFERTMLQWHEQQVKAKVVGIVGFGGIGKTTLAKAFFNRKRSDYHESSFLFEVRETSNKKSVSYVQRKLIEDLKHINGIKIDSPDQGIGILKQHLSHCQALIIIDDVDHADQLDGLLPVKDILHPESLILVTTRDKHVLKKSGVSLIYNLRGLNPSHSTELFCSYAFFQPLPPPEFQELVDRFVTACDGLPLSLKVIGALLCGENEIYWDEQFDLLRQSLPKEIEKRIRISYDSLIGREQEIFLDIACFFLGEDRDRAVRIWGQVGIRNLENKCLLEVDSKNKIRMHDHIRDSARNIAKEGCMPPRIWHRTTDSINALLELFPSAITEVRGITTVGDFNPRNVYRLIFHHTSAITEKKLSEMSKKKNYSHIHVMSNLQLVATEGSYLEGILRMVRSPPIIWLRWMGCSESSLPGWIPMENLKVLEMGGVMLDSLWPHHSQGPLGLLELTIVAPRLSEFPKSIGKLKHLQWISVNDVGMCYSGFVETLPQEFCELCSLKHLKLKWFLRLVSLPDLGGASSLQTLPNYFGDLIRLKHLSLKGCSSLTISNGALGNITTLEYLDLHGCHNVKELPPQVSHQQFLEKLYLKGTNLLKELPSDIGDLRNLEDLEIGDNSLEVLPPSFGWLKRLKYFKAYDLPKLKCLPDSFGLLTQLTELSLVRCPKLKSMPWLGHLTKLGWLKVSGCNEMPLDARCVPICMSLPSISSNYLDIIKLVLIESDIN